MCWVGNKEVRWDLEMRKKAESRQSSEAKSEGAFGVKILRALTVSRLFVSVSFASFQQAS